jgi:hypothetical protein
MLKSANQMIAIRDLRNQIAYQYIPEAIHDLVPDVIELTIQLAENINYLRDFLAERKWI